MQEIGIVKSVDGPIAKVLIARKSSCCDKCEKDVCDIPEDGVETEAINTAGAEVGQRVRVVMKSFTYVKGAVVLYVLPIFALILGAILGKMYLPSIYADVDSELLAAAGGFSAFFLSFLPVKILSSRMNKNTASRSVIESVVNSNT
jgi:sigma-E factor negative regulatory protein RseC